MPAQKNKPPDRESKELTRLLSLINTHASKQQLPSIDFEGGATTNKSLQWPVPQPKCGAHQHQSTEALALEQFSSRYQSERNFSAHALHQYFAQIFSALVKQRLCCQSWNSYAPSENILRVLVCLRIMMRDPSYQKDFFELGGVKVLAEHLQKATDSYLTYGDGPFVVDILKEMTNIFQKLSAVVEQRDWLVACGVHKALTLLLSANDVIVLHCSLHALISLVQSPGPRQAIGELNSVEILLRILQDYDNLSKKLAANLLRILCADSQVREMVKVYDGIILLLSLLHSDNIKLLWNVVWCLVQLSEDQDASNEIRQMGGIPLLLSLLGNRNYVTERTSASNEGLASATVHGRTPHVTMTIEEGEELKDQHLSLKSACCAALTELVLNDTNAQQIVLSNGIFLLGGLILRGEATERERKGVETLQANAFRALRFLFSMERNRRLFKRLFPPELFETFIDIGHYIRDINPYKKLVEKLNKLPVETLAEIRENILATDSNKAPSRFINDYAVMELLGSGAFGAVYKVKKKTAGQSFLAMKEINCVNPSFGRSSKEKEKSIGEIISELTIIREQMKHPNVVRYYKTFEESEKLYIVMELIEGAPIGEHFNSLKEKGEKFQEDRMWHVFIQMVLALRYLHKEKGIVHRDLTPNNIMLGENDKVTITDFGLAKQKQKDCSKMTSVVGTILYSCPEIVQSQPYGEKADIWAIGCILYQMATLNPPFYSSNMLSLATKIVEADFEPIPKGYYSEKLISTVKYCITASPEERPDIVQVGGHIAEKMMVHMDSVRLGQASMEKKLERERKRTQKHFYEANKNMQNYHRLFLASQERYDKLVNLASSGGAGSLKDGELSDNVFSDLENSLNKSRKQRNDSTSTSTSTSNGDDFHNANDRGWLSDDEECSSGSDSKESSGGSKDIATLNLRAPRPPGLPRGGQDHTRRRLEQLSQQLYLDIPSSAKCSRDSGISSGDPSPNNSSPPSTNSSIDPRSEKPPAIQRSHSGIHLDSHVRRVTSGGKVRPNSANTATLTISPRKVRQINDPILQMLHILHKIIYISQLPPVLCHNPRRWAIDRFKRALFVPQSTSFNLKSELKKLLMGSRDLIDLNFGVGGDAPLLSRQASLEQDALSVKAEKPASGSCEGAGIHDIGITYEQMQAMIEGVLVESGYYDMSPAARHRTLPLGPIVNTSSASQTKRTLSMGV